MNKGYVIMAQGNDYVNCANLLKDSILNVMPDSKVTIVTTEMLPYGDQATNTEWKLQNDWQVYYASPYDYTIKLEADMLITQPIDYWWDVLKLKDIVVSTKIRNFKQEISNVRAYRKFIDENNLPEVYNGITYFKKSVFAEKFFSIVRDVFENWDLYKQTIICDRNEMATTDWAYSFACHIMGVENTTLPAFDSMSMIHMKMLINDTPSEDWTDSLIYEAHSDVLRINTIPQMYPFHYHVKNFPDKIKGIVYGTN